MDRNVRLMDVLGNIGDFEERLDSNQAPIAGASCFGNGEISFHTLRGSFPYEDCDPEGDYEEFETGLIREDPDYSLEELSELGVEERPAFTAHFELDRAEIFHNGIAVGYFYDNLANSEQSKASKDLFVQTGVSSDFDSDTQTLSFQLPSQAQPEYSFRDAKGQLSLFGEVLKLKKTKLDQWMRVL